MAYSGRITIMDQQNNFVSAFSEIFRFLCDDPSTPGRDWEVIFTELDNSPNNFSYIQYEGTLNVESLNIWIYLPTGFVTEYTFQVNGNTLQEGIDYVIDWILGKVKFLTGTPPYEVSYSYKFKRYRVILKNTGLGGDEEIYVGFLLCSSGYDKANVLVRCYRGYIAGLTTFFDTTHGIPANASSTHPMFGFWSGAIDMWIFSNKQRIIIVARNNTYYTFCYVGNIFRLCPPKEYPQPLWIQTDLWGQASLSSTVFYDSTDSNRKFLCYPRTAPGWMINYANAWSSNYSMIPTQSGGTWRTIAYPQGVPRVLWPLYLKCDGMIAGMPDGFYFAPGLSLSSESQIQIGDDTYIIFQNCWRTGWSDFMAIKEA